jgi:predicted transcriptional regulator
MAGPPGLNLATSVRLSDEIVGDLDNDAYATASGASAVGSPAFGAPAASGGRVSSSTATALS